jgi:ceramide glucosyltransferase
VWSLLLLAFATMLRYGVAYEIAIRVLRDRNVLSRLWLIPVRDVLAVALWAVAYFSHTVVWRGDEFRLKNGKLERVGKREVA